MENKHNYSTELESKIALLTVGTKGIGKTITNRLETAGAKVIVTARTNPADANSNHHFIAADLTWPNEVS